VNAYDEGYAAHAQEVAPRIAALEAELERVTGERDRYEKQRDRAEQKYDALLVQLPKSTDYEFEVFDAEDGMPGLRMVSYKDRAEQAEAEATEAWQKCREHEAEVAIRDRMLRDIIERIALTPERWNGWTTEEVLADLRARAEKEAER